MHADQLRRKEGERLHREKGGRVANVEVLFVDLNFQYLILLIDTNTTTNIY